MPGPTLTHADAPLEEAAYRWTVRGLYLALIAANLFVIWDTYRDTPEFAALGARIRGRIDAMRNCEGCARRKAAIAAAANRLIFEAGEYLEKEAAAAAGEGEEGAA